MLLLLDPGRSGLRDQARRGRRPGVVPLAALAVVLVRLPFVTLPAGPDEAGFLQVAAQWHRGGTSLYGDYWVDRPPLLLLLFRLAALTGGIVPVRLLGCLAAAVAVLLCAWTARRLGGSRAASRTAVVAAALTASPLLDALETNGELLALPFVALGIGACVAAIRAPGPRRAAAWAALAGAAGVAAAMVKQNVVDVAVFGLVLLVAGLLRRTQTRRAAVTVAAGALAGGLAALGALTATTVALGTSPVEVFDATYPFRLRAARVVAEAGSTYADGRLLHVVGAWAGSGLALLTLCLLVLLVRSRLRDPVVVALGATAAFDVVSVAMGGGYWLHYLLQLVVPLAITAGLVRTRVPGVLAVASAAVALGVVALHPPSDGGRDVGGAIAAVAHPNDTLTTLYGAPEINLAAGLPSPYPYLWSLPVKTLDPHLARLTAAVDGPRPPTWLVVTHHVASWGLDAGRASVAIARSYHPVATIEGATVWLRDGVTRRAPTPP